MPTPSHRRIGIDGAQSSGKTTLFEALKPSLEGAYGFIPEAARLIAPEWGVTVAADWAALLSTPERLEQFFEAEERWVVKREESESQFIIDSSLWVVAAYREAFGCSSGVSQAQARNYDLLLHCEPPRAPATDGFRFTHRRGEVDAIYTELLRRHYRGTVRQLPPGTSRVSATMKLITGGSYDGAPSAE